DFLNWRRKSGFFVGLMTREETDKYRGKVRGSPCSEDRCDCAGAPFGPVERLIWETVPGGILHALCDPYRHRSVDLGLHVLAKPSPFNQSIRDQSASFCRAWSCSRSREKYSPG